MKATSPEGEVAFGVSAPHHGGGQLQLAVAAADDLVAFRLGEAAPHAVGLVDGEGVPPALLDHRAGAAHLFSARLAQHPGRTALVLGVEEVAAVHPAAGAAHLPVPDLGHRGWEPSRVGHVRTASSSPITERLPSVEPSQTRFKRTLTRWRLLDGASAPTMGAVEPEAVPRGSERAGEPHLSVAAVARMLGIAPATLRTWDRRYGIGPSAHAPGRHRRYSPQDIARLETMRHALVRGVGPAEAARYALTSANGGPARVVDGTRPRAGGTMLRLPGAGRYARGLGRAALALDFPA